YADWLADEMMSRFDLKGGTVLEVGCGKADFLALLADRGIDRGLGIDPGYIPERALKPGGSLEVRREWYGPDKTHLTGNLVYSRHLMEHIPNVLEFFSWLRESVEATPGAWLFTEVPDVSRVLAEG